MENLRPWMWRLVFAAFMLFFIAAGSVFGCSIMFTTIFLLFQADIHLQIILVGLGAGALLIFCVELKDWLSQYTGFQEAEETFDPGSKG